MERSTDRILTTHAGSLPRPSALQDGIRTLLEGQPFDEAALASQVKSAVSEAVRQQADAGVDIKHPELVAQRIANFAGLVGPENVVAGTDCGFSQRALNPRLHPSIVWAKLQALSDDARIASKQLFG